MIPPKPFKTYAELLDLLESRGMIVADRGRAQRKLAQVGYYRLSGFSYPCRKIIFDANGKALKSADGRGLKRADGYLPGTTFNAVFDLYLFDKKLRLLMLDALERIEIYVRSIIAHEMGKFSPLAYQNTEFIASTSKKDYKRDDVTHNNWKEWKEKQRGKIDKSKDDCIVHHIKKGMEIPFWVVIETWDFGMMQQYYNMLDIKYRNIVCARIEKCICPAFGNWLQTLNLLRNKCAHHTRIWNMWTPNPIKLIDMPPFAAIRNDREARSKLFGLVMVMWHLLRIIGPHSVWLDRVNAVIRTLPVLPNCSLRSMGFPDGRTSFC